MRRSVFYMGRSFTQRHLNACRSPLTTGFIRPNALSCTAGSLAASPLLCSTLMGQAGAGIPLLATTSSDAVLSQLLATIVAQGSPMAVLSNMICLQNMSTCVLPCERVLRGFALVKRR